MLFRFIAVGITLITLWLELSIAIELPPAKKMSNTKNNVINLQAKNSKPLSAFQQANDVALRHGLYGAIAGSVQVVSLMWLRTIVNYQYRYGVSTGDAVQALYNEGGIFRFYRGMPLALIQNPLMKFGAVAANEGSKVLVSHFGGVMRNSPFLTSSLGTFFSILWKLLLVPIETIKTVLQVDGSIGFQRLMKEVLSGNILRLYSGSLATIISTLLSHYPWFYVHNVLDQFISKSEVPINSIARSAFIGFVASVVSDCVSNFIRVVKTLKQTLGGDETEFVRIVQQMYEENGIWGLAGRGLPTRIVANGLQSIVFVVVWKLIPLYLSRFYLNKRPVAETRKNEKEDPEINVEA